MSRIDWLIERPIAHRGLHDAARGVVENSPEAIERACAEGYSVEFDIRETADGQAAVYHDASLERLTDCSDAVKDHSLAELETVGYRGSSDTITGLRATLDQIGGRVPAVIEIKTDWTGGSTLERHVADVLSQYGGKVGVMSFDPAAIATFRTFDPARPRGIVACAFSDAANWPELTPRQRWGLRHFTHFGATRPQFISYDANDLPSWTTIAARLIGMPVITWTIRSEAQRATALRWSDQVTFEGFEPEA